MRIVAPGKVVLVGEYAVLDGARAVVAAVDRGVQCDVHPADRLKITTPDGDDRYVRAALHDAPAAHYAFAHHRPLDLPSKPGLGGSAAAVVAARVAASAVRGTPVDPSTLAEEGTAIHRAVQGGGSGIDVVASAHGGVLEVHGDAVRALPTIHPVIVWSGSSAQTGPRVQQFLGWRGRSDFVRNSDANASRFSEAPIACVAEARALLDRATREAGIDWWTPSLRAICDLASAFGGAAKPSGAGGGDIAIAVLPDRDATKAYIQACDKAGHTVIPVRIAAGARRVNHV